MVRFPASPHHRARPLEAQMTTNAEPVDFDRIFTPVAKESQAPRYAQVIGQIESAIRRDLLPQGSYLPKEDELCERFGVARSTLRRAMGMLEAKGTISRTRRRGTRVEKRVLTSYLPETSRTIFDLISASRRVPQSTVRTFEPLVASPTVATLTGFPVGARLVSIVRERYASDLPLALLDTYVPEECVDFGPEILVSGSLNAALEARGWATDQIEYAISAVPLPSEYAEFMGVPGGAPTLLEQRSGSRDGALLHFSRIYYHPHHFQLRGVVDRERPD